MACLECPECGYRFNYHWQRWYSKCPNCRLKEWVDKMKRKKEKEAKGEKTPREILEYIDNYYKKTIKKILEKRKSNE